MSADSAIKYSDDEINIRPARKEDMATVAKMIQVNFRYVLLVLSVEQANLRLYSTQISIALVFMIDGRITS